MKGKLDVDEAYAICTPADSIRLYENWADSYDSDFVDSHGYVLHLRVAEHFLQQAGSIGGAVLDVGCGTGIVGARLKEGGINAIDGIDISPQMLAQAAKKKTRNGQPVYRKLIEADLTQALDIADRQYAGLTSAGSFTHGHLGPEPLGELWRIAAPGAHCAISVNTTHFQSTGFAEKLSADTARGFITEPELVEVRLYSGQTSNPDHANDTALIVLCQVRRT